MGAEGLFVFDPPAGLAGETEDGFVGMLRELVCLRLAQYRARGQRVGDAGGG